MTSNKICYLLDTISNPNAGTESQFLKLYHGLKNQGEAVQLTVLRDADFLQNESSLSGYGCLNINKMFSVLSLLGLIKFAANLKKQKVKIVHVFFNDSSIIAPLILKLFGMKVVISRRDMGFWYTRLNSLILKLNSRFIDLAVVNSEAVKNITHQVERISKHKIKVVYNGYSLNSETHDVPMPTGTILGIVANIRPIKRMQDAVQALANLQDKYPELQLVIVGAGNDTELMHQAKELGVGEHLHCLGSKSSPLDYIHKFDIALLCSESEGFSNAIIEYLHAGKPVVCSKVGGNPEIIESGVNGYLYEAGDVVQLTTSIEKILQDKEHYQTLSKNAQLSVKSRFDETIMLSNYQEIYRSL